jgi:hypothetical protein
MDVYVIHIMTMRKPGHTVIHEALKDLPLSGTYIVEQQSTELYILCTTKVVTKLLSLHACIIIIRNVYHVPYFGFIFGTKNYKVPYPRKAPVLACLHVTDSI